MEAKKLRLSAEEIANRLDRPQRTRGGWLACCPAHDDASPSLSIGEGDAGQLLLHCFAGCRFEEIEAALGILPESPVAPPAPPAPAPRKPKPEAEGEALTDRQLTGSQLAVQPEFYRQPHHEFMQRREQFFPYLTANREVWATIRRIDTPGQPKKIWPTAALPDGPRPLYLLPELLAQPKQGGGVLICEGEKTVHGALFYEPKWAVTCSVGGSAAPHKTDWSPVENRAVLIWPDNDAPGAKYAEQVAALCQSAGASSVNIVAVPPSWPEKWDLADELPGDATADDVFQLLLDAKPWPDDGFERLSDLFEEPDTPTEWVLDKVFPVAATSMLGARPGAGKSSIVRNFAMCVAGGSPFLGRPVKAGRVLMASLEENKKMLVKTLRKMGANGDNIYIRCTDMTNGVEILRAAIKRVRPTLVTIDALGDFLPGQDLNKAEIMKPALRLLSKLAHETGVHIFTSHHTKKGDLGPDSLLGSVAIAGGVDGIMLLDWKQESGERTLATYKQRYPDGDSLAPTLIGLDLDTYRIESLGLKREADRKGIEENILDVLTGLDEPMKRESLLQAVGGRKETAIRALHRLEETLKVDVIREGRGTKYQLHNVGG